MKTTMMLFTSAFMCCAQLLSAQMEVDKPIQMTGGSGERVIANLEMPVNGSDAVNKDYVDAAVAALGGDGVPTMLSDRSPSTMNILSASRYCRDLAEGGYTDWRIAKLTEIYFLISMDGTITNDLTGDLFITLNDMYSQSSNNVAYFRLSDGASGATSNTTTAYYARCVR